MKAMERWLFERAGLVIGLMNGIFIGFLIALFPVWWTAAALSKWWDIASATGTSLAALTGLIIWLHGVHLRRSEELLRATVASSLLRAPLHGIAVKLKGGADNLQKNPEMFIVGSERTRWLLELRDWRSRVTEENVHAVMCLQTLGSLMLVAIAEIDMFLGALEAQAVDADNALTLDPRARGIERLFRELTLHCDEAIRQGVRRARSTA